MRFEPVVAHELPDIFDRVQLRAFGRQRQEGDIFRHDEPAGEMPPGLVEQQKRVLAWRNFSGDLGKMQTHRFTVAAGQDERRALAFGRTDSAEDVGRGGALISRR